MFLKPFFYVAGGASFTYGCYRGYTLPKWHNMSDSSRVLLSVATGVKYVVPPFCLFKYGCLAVRLWNEARGLKYMAFPEWNRFIYGEWGLHHPNVV
jgi:hypothetical protein